MKRKIGELRGTPIIEGDKNLKTNKEIHISDLKGGGSGSGSGEVSSIEYLDLINADDSIKQDYWVIVFIAMSLYSKVYDENEGVPVVTPSAILQTTNPEFDLFWYNIIAVAIDFDAVVIKDGIKDTVKNILASQFGYTEDKLNLIPRLTKEEFYNLEA